MRARRFRPLVAAALALPLLLTACGGGDDDAPTQVESNTNFAAGTTMAKLSEAKSVKIGVKFDQPGLGYKKPGTDTPEGFDVEIAKIVAAKLGIQPDQVEWVETVSKNREPFLQNGTVDMVVASYSITDERRKTVGQAGPYYVTGQQLLVRKDDSSITGPDALTGKKVCSVTGSTSIKTVQEKYGAAPVPFATYTECVQQLLNNSVDAVTTDGSILLGYAAQQPGQAEGRRRARSARSGTGSGSRRTTVRSARSSTTRSTARSATEPGRRRTRTRWARAAARRRPSRRSTRARSTTDRLLDGPVGH